MAAVVAAVLCLPGLGSRPARVRTAFRAHASAPRPQAGKRSPQSRRTETGLVRSTGPAAGERTSGARRVIPLLVMDPGQSAPRISGLWRSWLSRSAIPRAYAAGLCGQGNYPPGHLGDGSISIAIFRYRIRSGCCAAILINRLPARNKTVLNGCPGDQMPSSSVIARWPG